MCIAWQWFVCMTCAHWSQKRILSPLELELQAVKASHRCWDTNWGPLEEQQVFFTTEASLQLLIIYFISVGRKRTLKKLPESKSSIDLLFFFPREVVEYLAHHLNLSRRKWGSKKSVGFRNEHLSEMELIREFFQLFICDMIVKYLISGVNSTENKDFVSPSW